MAVENIHYVMCPTADDRSMKAEPVYALTPEEAVQQMRELFRLDDFCQPAAPESLDLIRLAKDEELPWNDPKDTAFIITCSEREVLVHGEEDSLRKDYTFMYEGRPFTMRAATVAEKEESIRREQVRQDEEDEEQFNYGFNVLYPQMRDEGLL
jgi:hypothetical protein